MKWKPINGKEKRNTHVEETNWFSLQESDDDVSFIHEETDEDCIIGTFLVKEILSEMGNKIGTIKTPHEYIVVIRSNEGMIPHFHIYDKAGRDSKGRKGIHACVQIRDNMYFKHGCYNGELDADARKALDDFMNEIRTADEHSSGVGLTNFVHTINEWNEQNSLKKGMKNWVDKDTTTKPNYTIIRSNIIKSNNVEKKKKAKKKKAKRVRRIKKRH